MQRAAASSSSALRRLVAEAFNRSPILSRTVPLVASTFSRPLAASDRQLTLLNPINHPCRGYANRRNMVPSDMEDDDEEDDDEEDLDGEDDDDYEAEKDFSNSDEDKDDFGSEISEMSD